MRRQPASCDKRWPRERFACFSGSGPPSTTSRTRKRVPRYAQTRDMQTNQVELPIIKISLGQWARCDQDSAQPLLPVDQEAWCVSHCRTSSQLWRKLRPRDSKGSSQRRRSHEIDSTAEMVTAEAKRRTVQRRAGTEVQVHVRAIACNRGPVRYCKLAMPLISAIHRDDGSMPGTKPCSHALFESSGLQI